MRVKALGAELEKWPEVARSMNWPSLLIGNGASVNVWEPFAYVNLYETACDEDEVEQPLTTADRALFARLGTVNFEEVLSALDIAVAVGEQLDADTEFLEERIASIRLALIAAVHAVHVAWTDLTPEILHTYNATMRAHHTVYTTNYDLLAYWSLMDDATGFKDYFWGDGGAFSRHSTDVPDDCTRVLFLHGGLHLLRGFGGSTWKRVAGAANLLEGFGTGVEDGSEPLLITEGTAEDKLEAIYRSDYLSFAYEQFAADSEPLVIFGQGLSDQDAHLIRPLAGKSRRSIAVGIRRSKDAKEVIRRKAAAVRALPDADLVFFDARTHPLGDRSLHVG